MLVYLARHLLPVATPPVRDGAVAVDGDRIVAAGPRDTVLQAAGENPEVRDLGRAVLLPGLVNAHTHLELSWIGEGAPVEASYVGWIGELLALQATTDPERARAAAERAVRTIVARGTVAVGDVANATWIVPILARSPLHGIVFHEIYGFRAADAERLLSEAAGRLDAMSSETTLPARLRVVLTPHAPHTTSAPLLRALAGRSAAAREPMSIHVAESPDERDLLRDGSGALPAFFRSRDFWDEAWEPPGRTPVAHLQRLGALSPRTLAVHCVQLTHRDETMLQARGVTVVTCPRSNARLGVGRAPVPGLLRQGIPVALGTDSLASSPDLDLFAEMAALRREHPGLAPAAVLRMATLNGASALGLDDRLGTIEPGKIPALAVVALESEQDDPLEAVCSEPTRVYPLEAAPWER